MNENLFEAQYNVTKKSKLKKFYETNKILIFSAILILIIVIASVSFYSETKEKKKILSDLTSFFHPCIFYHNQYKYISDHKGRISILLS